VAAAGGCRLGAGQVIAPRGFKEAWKSLYEAGWKQIAADQEWGRAGASRSADGSSSIRGTKIFISGGDHDLAENIVHLVLARVDGAPPGTKGLTLFIVPKIRPNADGSLDQPNEVAAANIEH